VSFRSNRNADATQNAERRTHSGRARSMDVRGWYCTELVEELPCDGAPHVYARIVNAGDEHLEILRGDQYIRSWLIFSTVESLQEPRKRRRVAHL
jgi:hypothetical protein